jgi:VanZ family protein
LQQGLGLDAEAPVPGTPRILTAEVAASRATSRHVAFRALWALAAIAIATFIFVQSTRPAATVDDTPLRIILPGSATLEQKQRWDEWGHEVAHFGLFFGLAFTSLRAYGRTTMSAALAVAGGTLLYGVSDELHQALVPARDASAKDLGLDLLGAVSGSLGQVALLALISRRPR